MINIVDFLTAYNQINFKYAHLYYVSGISKKKKDAIVCIYKTKLDIAKTVFNTCFVIQSQKRREIVQMIEQFRNLFADQVKDFKV